MKSISIPTLSPLRIRKRGSEAIAAATGNAMVHVGSDRRADLIQRNLRLGLKLNLFGHFGLFPPLAILGPFLRQISTIRNRQTRTPRRHRQAHRHTAVLLLTHLTAVLTRDSDRMLALLWKSAVVYDPGQHWPLLLHRW